MDYICGLGLAGMFLSCSFPLTINQGVQETAPTFGWEIFAYECTFSIGHRHPQSGEFPLGEFGKGFSAYLSTQGRDLDILLG